MDASSPKNPALAAFLSLVIPGAGQIYNSQVAAGVGMLVATAIGYWIILVPGVLLHAGSIVWAYMKAKQIDTEGTSRPMDAPAASE